MIVEGSNCKHCDELKNGSCDGNVNDCMCKKCPRNLGQCMITRYCRETESVIL
ncbi:hypothetical protein KYB31_08340 [Clostridium felsineum]|uniref:Uncharacterized protein n=1 Tax=Clostridium felsineum TaxID=36839 RepID=A0A1S8L4F1_9CLOT|nr:hypothetical protein [Clostridium felsineum]URZ18424.1 hypothetical protein CLFE_045100 [Clostridium felsineum DSM 794]MCR3758996.1 hypothetical protein [Clostridium felsineum]URZ02644.1 hypothetical protein CLAUR_026660 [Clostridium felsineum]URZ09033.1 hypothetical protein CLROS_044390 [Clostridium felsineum]URZ09661.1 hypothetical protein CROST_003440 [Clostridium felsineum]